MLARKNSWLIGLYFLVTVDFARAQTQSEPGPRLYITGSRGPTKYETFYQGALILWPSTAIFAPWKPSIGFFAGPRLALEVSGLRYRNSHRGGAYGTTADGLPRSITINGNEKSWGIPLVARYTLTRTASHRLQIDILAGLSYVKQKIESEEKHTVAGDVTYYRNVSDTGAGLHGTIGVSGRFQLIPHLELVADYGFNHILRNVSGDVHTYLIGNPTGLTRNRSIGLRYRFNPRINKAQAKHEAAAQ